MIFDTIPKAEIVLTFAIDALLNYLNEDKISTAIYQDLGIKTPFIDEWRERHGTGLTRPLAQRVIMNEIGSTAVFMTPFILHSEGDNRDMALIHLSNHQAARDKMLSVHWRAHNSFVHCGKGSLYTFGFDKKLMETKDALFGFNDADKTQMRQELIGILPAEIHKIMCDGVLPVEELLSHIGNYTAAPNDDMLDLIRLLVIEKLFLIQSPTGNSKQPTTMPTLKDLLILPKQKHFFLG